MTTLRNPPSSKPIESANTPAGTPKDHTVGWILGGVGAVVVLAAIAATLALRLSMKHLESKANPKSTYRRMEDGGLLRKGDPNDVGLPIYPRARSVNGMSMDVVFPKGRQYMVTSLFDSKDPFEKVDEWYRQNLEKEFIRQGPWEKRRIPDNLVYPFMIQDTDVTYIKTSAGTTYVIALGQKGEAVDICLTRSGIPGKHAQ